MVTHDLNPSTQKAEADTVYKPEARQELLHTETLYPCF